MKDQIRKITTEALVSMVSGVTGMAPPADEPLPDFIQAPIDRAVERIMELFPILATRGVLHLEDLDQEALAAALDEKNTAFPILVRQQSAAYSAGVSEHSWFSKASTDVTAERRRQIEKGNDFENDDRHAEGQLAAAAAAYALAGCAATFTPKQFPKPPGIWPWGAEYWKPTSQRACLVKAGALVLAEIERIDRLEPCKA